jgi:hypothetical protein
MLAYLRANALGASALAVALAGTSIAVVGLPRNSVGTEQLKRQAVHTPDIAAGAVTGSKIGKSVLGASMVVASPGVAGGVPPDAPEGSFTTQTFTTRSKAQIFAFARGSFGLQCAAPSQVAVGLFIDDVALDGSGNRSLSSTGATMHLDLFGATSGLIPAGKHTLAVSFDCLTSDFQTGSFGGDGARGVIAIAHQPGTFVPTIARREPTRDRVIVRAHPQQEGAP